MTHENKLEKTSKKKIAIYHAWQIVDKAKTSQKITQTECDNKNIDSYQKSSEYWVG